MGNCIQVYRAAIGLFHLLKRNHRYSFDFRANTYQEILLTNIQCAVLVVSLFKIQSNNPNIDIVFLLFVLHIILICGNVEVNPGPESNDMSNTPSISSAESCNSITICNLNIRSVRNKLDFLHNFSDEFDIITLTETYLDPSIEIESFS